MTYIDSMILGIVEGLTEFLPISSTGHLILASDVLNLPPTDFIKSFIIIIQLGAIAGVLVLYFKDFLNIQNLKKIIAGSIPTAIIGFGLYKIIKNNLLGSETVVLGSLFIGGLLLIIFENFYKGPDVAEENIKDITYKQSFAIGIFQTLAVIPGVSRSASTIVGGLLLGIPRATIVKFSFLLAVPTLLGASLLDIVKSPNIFLQTNIEILAIGFFSAFVVAILSMKFLVKYVQKNTFTPFGIYRIFIAVIFFFLIT